MGQFYFQAMNSVVVGHSHSQDGGDWLHVLIHGDLLLHVLVGHAGLAVGADLVDLLHDGAHIEEGGRLGDAGIGINAFLSVFIHNTVRIKVSLVIVLTLSGWRWSTSRSCSRPRRTCRRRWQWGIWRSWGWRWPRHAGPGIVFLPALLSAWSTWIGFTMTLMGKKVAASGMLESE